MALGVGGGILLKGYHIPEITLTNLHPSNTPIWPIMFVSVACGAISGFHATQSPLMARCIRTEKDGRKVFYGAMVAEGIIALIWAAAGVAFYNGTGGLAEALSQGQSVVVYDICFTLLGPVGAVIAMIGVIACPVSSADTAYRSARLTLADWFNYDQKPVKNRLILTVPLLAVGAVLTQVDVQIVWRYFSWSNQTLAMIALWAASVYLFRRKRNYWITVVPASFMSAVSCDLYTDGAGGRLSSPPPLHIRWESLSPRPASGVFLMELRNGQGQKRQHACSGNSLRISAVSRKIACRR